ncbi:hypothetical protein [Vibrio owensii]|uniref:hypothetical protein n=1 Tax=Vibrio owensii TaxID=696485 RepID=UPI001294683B|nr:hypothetical protein [Vibrio owensii]
MKTALFLLLLSICSGVTFAQNGGEVIVKKDLVHATIKSDSSLQLNEQKQAVRQSLIESAPIELKVESNSKTDWAAIITQAMGFLITIVIVLTGTKNSIKAVETSAIQSMDSFQKSVAAQKEIADKTVMVEVLSRNRQEWINKLRDEVSSFTSNLIKARNFGNVSYGLRKEFDLCKRAFRDSHEEKDMALMISTKEMWEGAMSKERDAYESLRINKEKIHLLLNPAEEDSKELLEAIEQAFYKVDHEKYRDNIEAFVTPIRTTTQIILKKEWERVKGVN